MRNYTNRKEYPIKLLAYRDKNLVRVISGLRRSGKTTLLELNRNKLLKLGVKPEQIMFLNFENLAL